MNYMGHYGRGRERFEGNKETNAEKERACKQKEELWNKIFGQKQYNPDDDYSEIVEIIKGILQSGCTSEKYQGASKTKIKKIIEMVEGRKSKLDIKFLESLDNEDKYLISKLFIDGFIKKIGNMPEVQSYVNNEIEKYKYFTRDLTDKKKDELKKNILKMILLDHGDSLLIWMFFWSKYNYKTKSIAHKYFIGDIGLKSEGDIDLKSEGDIDLKSEGDIDLKSKGFNGLYFIQAYSFLLITSKCKDLSDKYKFNFDSDKFNLQDPDKFLFDVLIAYNLIKNLDGDIESMNNRGLDLGKDFSLKVLHAKDKIGAGYIKGKFSLNKDGEYIPTKKDLATKGSINKTDENGKIYTVLDRKNSLLHDEEGNLIDASGKEYIPYLDSPLGISLLYKNEPIALISFIIRNGEELFINQMQRVSYEKYDEFGRCIGIKYSNDFGDIDRQKSLYEIVEKIAYKYGVPRIVIQSGKNNKRTKELWDHSDFRTDYYKENFMERDNKNPQLNENGEVHLPLKIAEIIYDLFARENGFCEERGNYHKNMK